MNRKMPCVKNVANGSLFFQFNKTKFIDFALASLYKGGNDRLPISLNCDSFPCYSLVPDLAPVPTLLCFSPCYLLLLHGVLITAFLRYNSLKLSVCLVLRKLFSFFLLPKEMVYCLFAYNVSFGFGSTQLIVFVLIFAYGLTVEVFISKFRIGIMRGGLFQRLDLIETSVVFLKKNLDFFCKYLTADFFFFCVHKCAVWVAEKLQKEGELEFE